MKFRARIHPRVINNPDGGRAFAPGDPLSRSSRRRGGQLFTFPELLRYELPDDSHELFEILEDTDLIHPVSHIQVRWGGLEIELPDEEAGMVMVARDAMMEGRYRAAAEIMIEAPHLASLVLPRFDTRDYTEELLSLGGLDRQCRSLGPGRSRWGIGE